MLDSILRNHDDRGGCRLCLKLSTGESVEGPVVAHGEGWVKLQISRGPPPHERYYNEAHVVSAEILG